MWWGHQTQTLLSASLDSGPTGFQLVVAPDISVPSDRVSSVAGQGENCGKAQASPRRQATAGVAQAPVRKPLESDVELNVHAID